jgi:hypothetical protein
MNFKSRIALLIVAVLVVPGLTRPAKAQQAAARKKPPVTAKFTLTDMGLVTNSYLRMHRPDLLRQLALDVKAGKAPQKTLDSIVEPKLQSRLNGLTVAATNGKPTLQKANGASWSQIALSVAQAPEVDFTPSQLRFPDTWDKQTGTCTLHLTAPTDGWITAALGPKSPFTIKSMVALTGTTIRPVRAGAVAVRKGGTQVVKAPWSIQAAAGQDVDINLSFSPVFDLFSFTAGLYKDKLTVKGGGVGPGTRPWAISAPVAGMFNGIPIGVIGIAVDRDIDVVTDVEWYPGKPQTFQGQVKLINAGPTASGTIVAEGLPNGLSLAPVNITVPAGQTVTVTLTFALDQMTPFYDNLTDGTEVPLGVHFNHGSQSQEIIMDATLYLGQHLWEWQNNVASVNFECSFAIFKTGYFMAGICGFDANVFLGYEITAIGDLNNMEVMNMGVSVSPMSNFSTGYKFTRQVFKDNYIQFITSPIRMTVTANPT